MTDHSDERGLNRRGFMAAGSAFTLLGLAGRADTSDSFQNLLVHVDPRVRFCRGDLARSDNAFWDWQAASRQMASLQDFADRYVRSAVGDEDADETLFELQDALAAVFHPLAPFPEGMARDCVVAWLKECDDSLRLIDRGTARQHFQVPEKHLLEFLDDGAAIDDLSVPRDVVRVKAALCGYQLSIGETVLAARTAINLLDSVRMVLRGDGYLVHFLVALAVHGMSVELVHAFTLRPDTSRETLDQLRCAILRVGPTTESLACTYRMETTYFLRQEVSQLATTSDLRALIDLLVERNLGMGGLVDAEELLRVQQGMFQLFDGHACPFDPGETIQLYSNAVASLIDDLSSPWLKRRKPPVEAVLEELAPWPRSLWYVTDFLLPPCAEETTDEQSVSAERIIHARDALRSVRNPIGKLMLHSLGAFDNVRRAFHLARLKTDVALVLIACRLYRDTQKRIPPDLAEVVAAGLLDEVPIDPFTGNPLSYDATRGILCSPGFADPDEGTKGSSVAGPVGGEQLVWPLAP